VEPMVRSLLASEALNSAHQADASVVARTATTRTS
jgi:hypothetical protein